MLLRLIHRSIELTRSFDSNELKSQFGLLPITPTPESLLCKENLFS